MDPNRLWITDFDGSSNAGVDVYVEIFCQLGAQTLQKFSLKNEGQRITGTYQDQKLIPDQPPFKKLIQIAVTVTSVGRAAMNLGYKDPPTASWWDSLTAW